MSSVGFILSSSLFWQGGLSNEPEGEKDAQLHARRQGRIADNGVEFVAQLAQFSRHSGIDIECRFARIRIQDGGQPVTQQGATSRTDGAVETGPWYGGES